MIEPKFCGVCGKTLIEKVSTLDFNPETGKPYIYKERECPKRNIKFFGLILHVNQTHEGYEYWENSKSKEWELKRYIPNWDWQ